MTGLCLYGKELHIGSFMQKSIEWFEIAPLAERQLFAPQPSRECVVEVRFESLTSSRVQDLCHYITAALAL